MLFSILNKWKIRIIYKTPLMYLRKYIIHFMVTYMKNIINVSLDATVTFSSTSRWSTKDDAKEILTAEHNKDFSFHTECEKDPWIELDLKKSYVLEKITIFNRQKKVQERAYSISIQISNDKEEYDLIHKGFIAFKNSLSFDIGGLKAARYVKLQLDGYNYFHLQKIEVYADNDASCERLEQKSNLIFDNQSTSDFVKFSTFYIGSCRYMSLFPKHFPARLHTTKEIIQFLHNYNNVSLEEKDVKFIYGDLNNPIVIRDSMRYIHAMKKIFNDVKVLFLEITSRKYILREGKIYNNFYYNKYNDKYNDKYNTVQDDELYSDLSYIKHLVKNLFGITSIVVIPHIDIFLDDGNKIEARSKLRYSLKKICENLGLFFLDINCAFSDKKFSEVAPDYLHYSKIGFSLARGYIEDYLNKLTSIQEENKRH